MSIGTVLDFNDIPVSVLSALNESVVDISQNKDLESNAEIGLSNIPTRDGSYQKPPLLFAKDIFKILTK